MKKLNLEEVLAYSLNKIEQDLHLEIVGISRIRKLYGTNANSFSIKAINVDKQEQDFFIKFEEPLKISEEFDGAIKIQRYLPVPKTVMYSIGTNPSWICSEQIEGKLLTENYLESPRTDKINDSLVEIEIEKEKLLYKMYKRTKKTINYDKYLESKTNQLFYKRITGDRINDFYSTNISNNISKYFDYKIILNGKRFDRSINEIFEEIIKKFKKPEVKTCVSYLGHGDAHHGNIILSPNNEIWFIDAEYSDQIPVYMELAKPYYNDFLGELFFHYPGEFLERFDLLSTRESKNELFIELCAPKRMVNRLAITNKKIEVRKNLFGDKCDFLSLKDYLFMSHTLTKNPNNYSDFLQIMFLAFSMILVDFDPMNPESIYSYVNCK